MDAYRYTAINAKGEKMRGTIEAGSLLLAKERLQREKVLILELHVQEKKKRERRIAASTLQHLFKELGHLLQAGLPLHESLVALRDKTRTSSLRILLFSLAYQIHEGKSFSEAMRMHSKTFDPMMQCTIRIGEKSGALEETCHALAALLERTEKSRKQWMSALTYPLILVAFSLCVVVGLLLFVIPSLRELLENRSLSPLTSLIVTLSDWANAHLVLFFSMPCILGVGFSIFFSLKWAKRGLSAILLRMPLLKSLLIHGSLERFCRNASILLRGGTPLVETMMYATEALYPFLQVHFKHVHVAIAQGESLSSTLQRISYLPPLFLRMISLSEETGKMADAFHHLAILYEEEMQQHLKTLTALLQPLLLLLLGGIVGLVVFSILLPLTDASAFFD